MEILDENQLNGAGNETLTVNFKEDYIQTPFKVWKIAWISALVLGAIAGIVVILAENLSYPGLDAPNAERYAYFDKQEQYYTVSTICIILGVLCLLLFLIFNFIMLFRNWKVIEKSKNLPTKTAGQAVGFMFIPYFNLYWMFIAHGKMADGQQQFMEQAGIHIPTPPNKGLAIAYCVCMLIPFVNFVAILVLGPLKEINQKNVSVDIIRAMNE